MKKHIITLCLLLLTPTAMLFAGEQCLTDAESALNAKHYTETINYANQCIESFWSQALDLEHQLENAHAKIRKGAVSPAEKSAIFANGLLNDVATACFYKGLAAEKLMQAAPSKRVKEQYRQTAINAYHRAQQLSYGRHWDPTGEGFFWAPAEGAENHMVVIGN